MNIVTIGLVKDNVKRILIICLLDAEKHAMIVVIVKIKMIKLCILVINIRIFRNQNNYTSIPLSFLLIPVILHHIFISETNTILTTTTLTITSKFPTVITATSVSNHTDSLMQKTTTTNQIESTMTMPTTITTTSLSPSKITSGIMELIFK